MLQQPGGGGRRDEPVPQVFIGKVPPGLPLAVLEQHFAPHGASNVRLLEGKNCGFANFPSWAAAERAIAALNGLHLVEGAAEGINVKLADMKGAPKGKDGKPKVFMGGLSPGATEDVVFQVCSQFGAAMEVKIFCKNPGAPPCAFVTFPTFTEAELCISTLHGVEHELLSAPGKTLNVRFADQSGAAPARQTSAGVVVGGGAIVGGARVGVMSALAPPPPPRAMPGGGGVRLQVGGCGGYDAGYGAGPAGPGRRPGGPGSAPPGASNVPKIFLGGLPEAATEDFIWGMLAPFGEVVEAKLLRKPGAAPCGFIRLSSLPEAEVAVATLGPLGRYTVKFADDGRAPNGKRTHQEAFQGDPGAGWFPPPDPGLSGGW